MGTSDDRIPSLTPNVTSSSEVPVCKAQENAKEKSQAPKVSVASLITKASMRNSQRSVRVQKWFEDSGAHIVEGKYNALLGNGFSKENDEQILRDVTRTFPTVQSFILISDVASMHIYQIIDRLLSI